MALPVLLRVTISLRSFEYKTMMTNIIVPAWSEHSEQCILKVPDVNIIPVHSAHTAQLGQLETRATGNEANVRLIDRKVGGAGEQFINVTAHSLLTFPAL